MLVEEEKNLLLFLIYGLFIGFEKLLNCWFWKKIILLEEKFSAYL